MNSPGTAMADAGNLIQLPDDDEEDVDDVDDVCPHGIGFDEECDDCEIDDGEEDEEEDDEWP